MQILHCNYANKHKNAIEALSLGIGAQQSSSPLHAHHAAAITVHIFLWREEGKWIFRNCFS